MRRVLLAVLLVTGPLAGCTLPGDDGVQIDQPRLPTGLTLTYEITADGTTGNETFLVHNGTPKGTDFLAYNLSRPNFTSALLAYNDEFNPRRFNWSNVWDFPLEPGDAHDARIDGVEATITWNETAYEGPLDAERQLLGVARTDDGTEIARFGFADLDPAVPTSIQLDVPDGTQQTWELVSAKLEDGWNGPPTWQLGDWWTYQGTFRGETNTSQVVYTNDRSREKSTERVLNPRNVENRVLMLPFQRWRDSDVAPKSGFVSSMMSKFWEWPLQDGKTWDGSTTTTDGSAKYTARAELTKRVPLPDGTVTVGFRMKGFVASQDEPFTEFVYAPLADHLTEWTITRVGDEDPVLDFELVDRGERFQGEFEIPRRAQLLEIPPGNQSAARGPAQVTETFQVPSVANTVQVAAPAFAVHQPDVDPEFQFELSDPNGTVVQSVNESDFTNRRLDLADVHDAQEGEWRANVTLGAGVSMLANVYANWFTTETLDCTSQTECR